MPEPAAPAGPAAISTVRVRLATPQEYDAVGELTVAGYLHDGFLRPDDGYVAELRDAARRAEEAELWVADRDGEPVGTVTFCPPGSALRELGREEAGEFRMLSVDPLSRGHGVARALVEQCMQRSRELGLHEVVLCSMGAMTAAHALYRSFGFVRDESLDWWPRPDVVLLGFRAPV